ncbi:MAG: hypothetical protein QXN95_02045 [Candidatus Bathyarchaeia archaeon]
MINVEADYSGLATSKEELKENLRNLNRPISIEELTEILGSTVKHDNENKAICFLTMLLTYTSEDQINIGFIAESSTGKSYIPLELAWYFPQEDVLEYGYSSPTAFFHDYGSVERDPFNERHKIIHVNLAKKILIFLDQPHDALLQRLRPLLSHDRRKITLKITDKKEKSGLRTKTVILEGFPTVIFCAAKFRMEDQEKTRLLLLSPEISQEKLRESVWLKILRESNREIFNKRMEEDLDRKFLATRVWAIKNAGINYVIIPEELSQKIYEEFLNLHKNLVPRHQRDISRLLALVKAHALLNFMHRKREGDAIITTEEDVKVGFQLYEGVSEANEHGLSPEIWRIYKTIKPYFNGNGLTRRDFQQIYFQKFHKPIGYDYAGLILKTLTGTGLITEEADPNDKRVIRYMSFEGGVTSPEHSSSIQNGIPHPPDSYICEVCGRPTNKCYPREGRLVWLCDNCLSKWEGSL